MADFDPFAHRYDLSRSEPPADDRLDGALRSTLLMLSERGQDAELPSPAAQIRALGDRRRRRRIATTLGLLSAVAVVIVTIAVAGTSSALQNELRLTPATTMTQDAVPLSTMLDATPNPAHDIGYLTAVQRVGDHLVITFDRVIWLAGPAAAAQNGGILPAGGHLIVNNNPRLRTFALEPGADLLAHLQLGGRPGAPGTSISGKQLIERTAKLVGGQGRGPLVTIAHTGGSADGPVIRLEEITNP